MHVYEYETRCNGKNEKHETIHAFCLYFFPYAVREIVILICFPLWFDVDFWCNLLFSVLILRFTKYINSCNTTGHLPRQKLFWKQYCETLVRIKVHHRTKRKWSKITSDNQSPCHADLKCPNGFKKNTAKHRFKALESKVKEKLCSCHVWGRPQAALRCRERLEDIFTAEFI